MKELKERKALNMQFKNLGQKEHQEKINKKPKESEMKDSEKKFKAVNQKPKKSS